MPLPTIAPPPWQAKMFFTDSKTNSGWSETFFVNTASLAGAQGIFTTLIDGRLTLLTNRFRYTYGFLSSLNVKGDGYPSDHNFGSPGTFVVAVGEINHPGVALVQRWSTGNGYKAIRFIRGVPEDCVLDGVFAASATWGPALTAFATVVITNCVMPTTDRNTHVTTFAPVTQITNRYVTTKKVGRPFGLPRGRAAIH